MQPLLPFLLLFATTHASSVAADRPNILFAISDDQSWPHASAYGCSFVETPAFDRVARDGLLFNNAYTPNGKCAPSRAAVLTGRNSWQLEAAGNHHAFFPEKFRTFPEALEKKGYVVGMTGKGWGPGSAKGRNLCGKPWHKRTAKPPAGGISGKDYAGNFEEFLKARTDDQPFCFWYGAHEPHRGYEFKAGATKGGKKISQVDRVPVYWPDTPTVRHDMLDYAFEIEHFDNHLGRMLALLEEHGELENTLVVVTADNGMPFPRAKGQPYDAANHLPLAIMWPKGIKKPGRVINDYVSFIDFAPTFLKVAGLDEAKAAMQPVTGRSLTEFFQSMKASRVFPHRDHVLIGKEMHDTGRPKNAIYAVRGLVKDEWMLIHNLKPDLWPAGNPLTGYPNTDGGPTKSLVIDLRRTEENTTYWQQCFGKRPEWELYHLPSDPDCLDNRADAHEQAERVSAMSTFLIAQLTAQADPRVVGPEHYFESFPSTNGTWNLYERVQRGEKVNDGWINRSDREKTDE